MGIPLNITSLAQLRHAARALIPFALAIGGLPAEARRSLTWMRRAWFAEPFSSAAGELSPLELQRLEREMNAVVNVLCPDGEEEADDQQPSSGNKKSSRNQSGTATAKVKRSKPTRAAAIRRRTAPRPALAVC